MSILRALKIRAFALLWTGGGAVGRSNGVRRRRGDYDAAISAGAAASKGERVGVGGVCLLWYLVYTLAITMRRNHTLCLKLHLFFLRHFLSLFS